MNDRGLPLKERKERITLTEKEIPSAQFLIDAGWEVFQNRPLTEKERKGIIDTIDSIAQLWYADFSNAKNIQEYDESDDANLLKAADAVVSALKIGMLFMQEPSKEKFDALVETVKDSKCWEIIMYIFNVGDCFSDTNWLLMSYEQIYKYVPEERRYGLGANVYVKGGFDFPTYLMKDLQSIRPSSYIDNIPIRLRNKSFLTVYRASTATPNEINRRIKNDYPTGREISWTISPEVAMDFYARRKAMNEPCFLYSGIIKPNDIIYFNKGQAEILQLGSVTNVKQIQFIELMTKALKEMV